MSLKLNLYVDLIISISLTIWTILERVSLVTQRHACYLYPLSQRLNIQGEMAERSKAQASG
jgi:hypothetical protein